MASLKLQVQDALAIITSDSIDIPNPASKTVSGESYTIYRKGTKGCVLYVGVTGDVKVTMAGGNTVVYTAMVAGWQPINVTRVWATGTAATNLVAAW